MKASLVKLTYVDEDGAETILSFNSDQELELIKALNAVMDTYHINAVRKPTITIDAAHQYVFIRGHVNG